MNKGDYVRAGISRAAAPKLLPAELLAWLGGLIAVASVLQLVALLV